MQKYSTLEEDIADCMLIKIRDCAALNTIKTKNNANFKTVQPVLVLELRITMVKTAKTFAQKEEEKSESNNKIIEIM